MEIRYCPKNEASSKQFIKKFEELTDSLYDICIKWVTKRVKQLFKPKCKNPHSSCLIYEFKCVCNKTCIGGTRKNAQIRCNEHEDSKKNSEPVKHLRNHSAHSFLESFIVCPS